MWDLYFKHQEPTLQVQVTDCPLTSIATTLDGQHLAVGALNGTCTILKLCSSMYVSPKEEKSSINAMLEREGLRCVFLPTASVLSLRVSQATQWVLPALQN